jgi:hypothetical protein
MIYVFAESLAKMLLASACSGLRTQRSGQSPRPEGEANTLARPRFEQASGITGD